MGERVGQEKHWSGRWLDAGEVYWRIQETDTPKGWEFVERKGKQGAVCLIATVPSAEPKIVAIRQYRPPFDQTIIEFPAGLIDAGEAPEVAAQRELLEETGYIGQVTSVGPAVCTSPGLTTETVIDVHLNVTGQTEARPEASEEIEVILLPLHGLWQFLARERDAGYGIDARLWYFAQGMRLGGR